MNSTGLGAAAVRRRMIFGLAAASLLLLTGAPPPALADAAAVLRHGAAVSESNALIAEVQVALSQAARVFVEYDNPQAGRYRTALTEPAAEHAIPIVRLRAETTYDYTVFVLDGEEAVAGPEGRFTTGALPPRLAAVTKRVTGRSSQPLIMSIYRHRDGTDYFPIWDEVGATVWYYDQAPLAGPIRQLPGGNFIVPTRGAIVEITPLGEVVNRIEGPHVGNPHHDLNVLADGRVIYPSREILVFDDSVNGGSAETTFMVDNLRIWDPASGRIRQVWDSKDAWDVMDPDQRVPAPPRDDGRFSWTHLNSITVGPRGNYVLSFRGRQQVVSLSSDLQTIEWQLNGPDSDYEFPNPADRFYAQHTASQLGNGNVLVFDNGRGRPDSEGGLYSRALELRLDEAAGTAVKAWEYRLEPDRYSARGGSAYRLSNGNTLVNFSTTALEGVPLTVVEVAADGSEVFRIDTLHADGGVPSDRARGMAYGGLEAIMGETMLRPPAAADAAAVMRHSASISETNALIAEVRVSLSQAARVFVEYDNPQAGRYRTAVTEPGAEHAIPIVRLRAETTYDYTVFVLDGEEAVAGPEGRFTTGALPPPLAAVTKRVTGRSSQPLIMSGYRHRDGTDYFPIWDEVGATVWYYDQAPPAGPIKQLPGGNFIVPTRGGNSIIPTTRGAIVEITPLGEVVNRIEGPQVGIPHHDLEVLADGRVIYPSREILVFDDSVNGGSAETTFMVDNLRIWDPASGRIRQVWDSKDAWDVMDPDQRVPAPPRDDGRFSWTHLNSITVGPRGNYVLSFRGRQQVVSLSSDLQTIEWQLNGPDSDYEFPNPADRFYAQHTASQLGNGNVLVFDNGRGRPDSEGGLYSRALELRLDEAAGTAVKAWEYRLEPDRYSAWGGSAYRLSNGNTLVNFASTALEGVPLTVVEVAADGSEVFRIDTLHADGGVPSDRGRGWAYGGLGAIMGETMLRPPAGAPDVVTRHMVAQAMLAAHYIDAALKAGMQVDEINATLAAIAERSVITEFWISDETGRIAFTNVPGADFSFPTDPDAGTQAAPFAVLLDGATPVVAQDAQPREMDAAIFKYVGVAGVDQPRIVQVGVSAAELESP